MMSLSININHDNLNEVPTGEGAWPPIDPQLHLACRGWIAKVPSDLHEFLRPLRARVRWKEKIEFMIRFGDARFGFSIRTGIDIG